MPDIPTAPVELKRTALPFPVYVDNRVLAGSAETFTKPAGAAWALISASAITYVRTGGTAVVPGSNVVDGTGSFPVHAGQDIFLNVESIASFSAIATGVVAVAWFRDHGSI